MINKKITLKKLAAILKVSVSTVSKALNDSYEISEATKKKVKTAAIKYNYSPNLLAQGLKTRKTKIFNGLSIIKNDKLICKKMIYLPDF